MPKFLFALLIAAIPFAASANDPETAAILAQEGCYNVTYESRELGTYAPGHEPRSRYFRTGATELVVADHISDSEIVLQHITQFQGMGENHWGQIWRRAPAKVLEYQGNLTWRNNPVSGPAGKWAQFVTQVDGSPRYDCAAPWSIDGGVREWACRSWSPLPRREHGRRDYNVLERNNRHILTHTGWIHHQENRKLRVENGKVTPVATELTINTYERLPMSECSVAEAHWKMYGPSWRMVRGVWMSLADERATMKFRAETVAGKTLWMRLFEAVEEQQNNPASEKSFVGSIRDAIAEFLTGE